MNRPFAAFLGLSMIVAPAASLAADLPLVLYEVRETAGSWQPLAPSDLAKTVEQAALEELSKRGLMRLAPRAKGKNADDADGDYRLEIEGRILDEAETHTVYLTFSSGRRTDVPSLNATHTVVLSKRARAQILKDVEASARTAAKRLLAVLEKPLAMARSGSTGTPSDEYFANDKAWRWQWPEVRIPQTSLTGAADRLGSKNRDVRMAALRELTSLALTDPSPRHVLEQCVLDKKQDAETRLGCLRALRPISRRPGPTQQVVIEAFRRFEKEDQLRREANEQMEYMSGLARKDVIQAWLESAARGKGTWGLAELGDIPNLDLAIRACLYETGKTKSYNKRESRFPCVELLRPVPHDRRRAILWRFLKETNPDSPYYFESLGASEGSHGTPWERAMKSVLEGARSWDPELEEILWARYQRTLSSSSLDALTGYGAPSKRLATRMLEVLQTAGEGGALRALERFGKAQPELRPMIREKLAELLAMGTYPKKLGKHQLERALKGLEKEEAR